MPPMSDMEWAAAQLGQTPIHFREAASIFFFSGGH
jgi:hypothetical protein